MAVFYVDPSWDIGGNEILEMQDGGYISVYIPKEPEVPKTKKPKEIFPRWWVNSD